MWKSPETSCLRGTWFRKWLLWRNCLSLLSRSSSIQNNPFISHTVLRKPALTSAKELILFFEPEVLAIQWPYPFSGPSTLISAKCCCNAMRNGKKIFCVRTALVLCVALIVRDPLTWDLFSQKQLHPKQPLGTINWLILSLCYQFILSLTI